MISIVCWKWRPPAGYRSTFGPETVNVLRRMVDRHYTDPHRFICVTDDPAGLDPGIEVVPLWSDLADLRSPHGGHQPACYRRLRAFSVEAGEWFGPRFVSLDLDTVIVGDMRPLWNRPEDFIIWGETDPRSFYNGSMWLLTAGARRELWEEFDPHRSPAAAFAAGRFGSDQGWISYRLGPGQAMWGVRDGVYSYRIHIAPDRMRLPPAARIVMFHGRLDPWSREAQQIGWIREHWR